MKKTISIIGAGRVGRALGRALRQRGWRIGGVVTLSRRTARTAVRAIGGGKACWGFQAWPFDADVLIVATPDRASKAMAGVLSLRLWPGDLSLDEMSPEKEAASRKALLGKVVLHTSGSLSHEVLAPLRKHGAAIGAMHPMQSFGRGAATRLDGVVFGLDGDARAVRLAQQIVRSLGGIPVRVNPKRKVIYHLSGGFAAQHLLVVLAAGVRILMDAGLTRKQATQALLSMGRQTMENLERHGARKAWTGPVPRGDYGTVAKHVAALRGYPNEYRQTYVTLTRLAAQLLARNPRKMQRELDRVFNRG